MIRHRISFLAFLFAFVSGSVLATEPNLRALDIRGLRINGTTTLTIDGDDLGKAPRLLLPFNAKQALKPGSTDKKAVFDVALAGDVDPGYYHLRVASDGGVSLPFAIAVDRMPQVPIAPMVNALPVAQHGSVANSAVVETKFQGKAKQRLLIEVEAQRLGGKLRPVIHLYSPKKLQIGWSWGTPSLFGDARLEATLPEDGIYSVTLHDAEYAAPTPSFYRLRIGDWAFVDQVFPPAVNPGAATKITMMGMPLPSDSIANPAKIAGVLPLSWPKGEAWSGPRPFVTTSPHAEYVESTNSGKVQDIPEGLAGISGKLLAPYEEDRYRVAVKPGSKVKLEVFAERLGSAIDVALVVRNDKGDQLARAEDSPGTLDPVLEYTVPDKITSIIVGVVDAQGRGGPRGVYRLVVDPQGVPTKSDGYSLSTLIQRVSLPIGGRAVVPIFAERQRGFIGKIELTTIVPMPVIKTQGATIMEGTDGTLMTLERTDAAFDGQIAIWQGRSDGNTKIVTVKNHPLERLQPWLATEIALAPSNEKASEFAIDWRDLPENTSLTPASRVLLPIKLTRPAGKDTVKLTLLTSQRTPLLNNQPDPNKAIRQDKIAELAATVATGDVTMLVPAELPSPHYDVTVQAELLDAGKKPIATAYAPVRRMPVLLPIALKLDGPTRVETLVDPKKGATVKLQGKIERREGFKGDVALALTGIPPGAKAEAVTVKADANTFAISFTLPPMPASEIGGVKLSGSYVPDAKQPTVRVRSRELEITLVLKSSP